MYTYRGVFNQKHHGIVTALLMNICVFSIDHANPILGGGYSYGYISSSGIPSQLYMYISLSESVCVYLLRAKPWFCYGLP